jgi:NIPSNAP
MTRTLFAALLLTPLAGLARAEDKAAVSPESSHRVFELRTYHTNDGKLADLHRRFRDHTCALLKKHGAELIGFWTPLDDKDGKGSKLIYLVAFPSREAAAATWKAFSNDPEWKRVYAESHKNGVLVNKVESVYMEPTDYSALK